MEKYDEYQLRKAVISRNICEVREILNSSKFTKELGISACARLLYVASIRGNAVIIKLLVDSLNFGDTKNLQRNLIVAVILGKVNQAKTLLEGGASLHGTEWKSSLLMYKYIFKRTSTRNQMLRLLFDYGLDKIVRYEKVGQRLLHFFINSVHRKNDKSAAEVAELFINPKLPAARYDEFIHRALDNALYAENNALVKLIIKHGASLKNTNEYLVQLMDSKFCDNYAEFVDILLSNGADINVKNDYNETPIYRACYDLDPSRISLLLRKGTDITSETISGLTPFYAVCQMEGKNRKQCIMLMVKEISKLTYAKRFVLSKDMDLMKTVPEAEEHFHKCLSELQDLTSVKFYKSYSYYDVLNMGEKSIKKLAHLMKNKEFVNKLEENYQGGVYYDSDLKRIIQDARKLRDEMAIIVSRLNSIFCDYLPDLVVEELAKSFTIKDLPLP